MGCGKGKSKFLPRTGHEDTEGEQRYSSTLSLTSVLDDGGWSTPRPGRFTPGNDSGWVGPRGGLDGRGKSHSRWVEYVAKVTEKITCRKR
jgi:hypothetical protein